MQPTPALPHAIDIDDHAQAAESWDWNFRTVRLFASGIVHGPWKLPIGVDADRTELPPLRCAGRSCTYAIRLKDEVSPGDQAGVAAEEFAAGPTHGL